MCDTPIALYSMKSLPYSNPPGGPSQSNVAPLASQPGTKRNPEQTVCSSTYLHGPIKCQTTVRTSLWHTTSSASTLLLYSTTWLTSHNVANSKSSGGPGQSNAKQQYEEVLWQLNGSTSTQLLYSTTWPMSHYVANSKSSGGPGQSNIAQFANTVRGKADPGNDRLFVKTIFKGLVGQTLGASGISIVAPAPASTLLVASIDRTGTR